MYSLFRNSPSFSAKKTELTPAWIWPQGCSMRQRATRVGAMFCEALKNAALPRQALVRLVVLGAGDGRSGRAAEIEQFGFGVVVGEGALGLAHQQPAHGGIALAQTRDVAVDA